MTFMKRRAIALSLGTVVLVAVGGTAATALVVEANKPNTASVTTAEAKAALQTMLELPATAALCDELAGSPSSCEKSYEDSANIGFPEAVTFSGLKSLENGSVRASITGTLGSGESFRSQVEVVRQDGEVLIADPIYWVPRHVPQG